MKQILPANEQPYRLNLSIGARTAQALLDALYYAAAQAENALEQRDGLYMTDADADGVILLHVAVKERDEHPPVEFYEEEALQ